MRDLKFYLGSSLNFMQGFVIYYHNTIITNMTVEKLIEFLEALPKDTEVVIQSAKRDGSYREVTFHYLHAINADGSMAKRLEVR